MTAYVTLLIHVRPGEEVHFEEAYRQVSQNLHRRIPGQLYDELLRPLSAGDPYILLSQWSSIEAYSAWTQSPSHRRDAAPLREYWLNTVSRTYTLVTSVVATREDELYDIRH
jgi:heme oxygenase (mycobilin-producing)